MENYEISFNHEGIPVINGTPLEAQPSRSGGVQNYSMDGFPYLISSPAKTSADNSSANVFINGIDPQTPPTHFVITQEGFDSIDDLGTVLSFSGEQLGSVTLDARLTASLNAAQLIIPEGKPGAIEITNSSGEGVMSGGGFSFTLANGALFSPSATQYTGMTTDVIPPKESSTYYSRIHRQRVNEQNATTALQERFDAAKIGGCQLPDIVTDIALCTDEAINNFPDKQAPVLGR